MIRVDLRLADGCVESLLMEGHAPTDAGVSVVCAAVTGIVRAAVDALLERERTNDLCVTADAPTRGRLSVGVANRDADRQWLRGVTDVLVTGLVRIAQEAPADVTVRVERN